MHQSAGAYDLSPEGMTDTLMTKADAEYWNLAREALGQGDGKRGFAATGRAQNDDQ